MTAKGKKGARNRSGATRASAKGGHAEGTAAVVRLARVARGRKPQYFSDPAIDRLLWMTVTLMEELAVTRERLDTMERLLARKKVLRASEIDKYVPDQASAAARAKLRADYVDRVLRILQSELEEIAGEHPRDEEAVEAVTS